MTKNINELKSKINYHSFYTREVGPLKPSKDGWCEAKGLCIFHHDKSPGSFSVNINHGGFNCFSCGAKGDILDFIQHKFGLDFKEALKKLESEVY
jgi:DNA primase